ncbi:hypothetical protein M3Y97_00728700 [Aphelenchoides bicaudatus]|nr:hypothetical protein M3Y97_00728700 [Aphelenchoides bicaudatus]
MVCARDFVVNGDLLNEKIGKNVYTMEEILMLLNKYCSNFQSVINNDRIKKLNIEEVGYGKGLLSNVYCLDLQFESGKKMDFILKIPTGQIETHIEKENDRDENMEFNAHQVECDAYELFRGRGIAGMPHVYYTEKASSQKPGLIIMENLGTFYDTLTLSTSATVEQSWAFLRLLAKLQAQVNNSNVQWRGRFRERAHTDVFYESFIDTFIPLLLKDHPEFKTYVNQLDCITNKRFGRYALVDRPAELGATSFCQGDCWFNNIFIEKTADGALTNTPKFICDWQLVHEGNPLFDFARFLITGADGEIRREIQPDFAEKFYKMLVDEYEKQSNGRLKPNFTLEQGQELFDLAILEQTSVLMILLPFVSTDKTGRNGSPKVVEAKLEKLALRTWLGLQDSIELVDKWQLDDFANRK